MYTSYGSVSDGAGERGTCAVDVLERRGRSMREVFEEAFGAVIEIPLIGKANAVH